MVTASLTNYRQSPRKVRLVANLIRGKSVLAALDTLSVTTKRASDPLVKLLNSALANAKNLGIDTEGLFVKECTVNQGLTMKRFMPGARGSGFPIHKKTSHVHLVLGPKNGAVKAPKAEAPAKAVKKEEEKAEPKKAVKKAPAKKK
jgi:large subunit ribosomal protein L22